MASQNQELQQTEVVDPYTSFAWHPHNESVIVAVSKSGKLSQVEVTERIAPSWSAQHCLMWAQGGNLRSCSAVFNDCDDLVFRDTPATRAFREISDISVLMQKRARLGRII